MSEPLRQQEAPQRHGGDLRALAARMPLPETVHDFSVNTHPFGPHPAAVAAAREALAEMAEYPDPGAEGLAERVAAVHGLAPACIVPGNGAAELIDLIPRALRVRRALIVPPAFGEYADAVVRAGGQVIAVPREPLERFPTGGVVEAIQKQRPELVVLCSPNNPTGERLPDVDLEAVLAACEAADARLLLDEAFVEYDPLGSRIGQVAGSSRLMVLHSLTKFFGLAGLRAGYLAAAPELAARIAGARGPWSVNRIADAAARSCVGDAGYVDRERRRIAALREGFARELAALGLTPLPSDANFLLCRLPPGASADRLYEDLARDGFLIRHCGSFGLKDRYIRLRVHRPEVNAALLAALARRLRG